MNDTLRMVVVGAGAIGSTVAGWITPHYDNLFLLARGESGEAIKNRGLKSYLKGEIASATPIPLNVIESLTEIPPPDIVVITVKNYDLDETARQLREQLGDHEPLVVGLQNGTANQQILPQYFSRVIYGVVSFNAWRDAPGEVGHDPEGYIVLGTPTNDLQAEQQQIAEIFNLGLHCTPSDRLQDAVHSKLVINLANALMTLVGFQLRPIQSFKVLVQLTTKLMWEGVQVVQAAGFKEHRIGIIPPWNFVKMGAKLPAFITAFLYKFNAKKLGLNSMSQDVFGGKMTTELESLNGYMLNLARQVGVAMPINEEVYEQAKVRFVANFQPMSEIELWAAVQNRLKSAKNKMK
ncbi:MAG TPA: 2-dehydropantoate 2-reductase [Candidatus Lokiarchaeia archaeon]|nr:2-dehydropantoate 2-reductase [Candidatus Lokiarchaeia archaeon]